MKGDDSDIGNRTNSMRSLKDHQEELKGEVERGGGWKNETAWERETKN